MNKEFYERILVAKYIQEKFKQAGKDYTITECYYYVQQKGDSESLDMIWLSVVGDNVTWEDHLEDVCFKVLDIVRCQPGYCPFTVTQETLDSDNNYANWYYKEWLSTIYSLVKKYSGTWATRLESKINRGMTDIVSLIFEEMESYSEDDYKDLKTNNDRQNLVDTMETSTAFSK